MKKTLAIVLAVVMAVSCCCVLFVSADTAVNLAAGLTPKTLDGKELKGAEYGGDWAANWCADLTDGKAADKYPADGETKADQQKEWFAFYYNKNPDAEGVNVTIGEDGVALGHIVLDLGEVCTVNKVTINLFIGNQDGILPPKSVKVEVSEDGTTYTELQTKTYEQPTETGSVVNKEDFAAASAVSARYVHVTVEQNGVFAFLNEVEVWGTKGTANSGDETSAVDEVAQYTEEIAAKVGAVENAKGSVKLDSKLEGNKITVTLTIDDIAADAKDITGIAASLYFDADKVELDTSADNNPHAPSVGKIIKAPNLWNGEGYMTKPSEETANKIEVTIAGVPSKMGEAIPNLTKDDPVVLEFTFTLKDGAKMAGFWVTSESVIGYDTEVEPTGDAFQGGYTVAKTAVADTSSEASSSTSTAPKPGDTGIIMFAILGIVAVAGAAIVVKVRH